MSNELCDSLGLPAAIRRCYIDGVKLLYLFDVSTIVEVPDRCDRSKPMPVKALFILPSLMVGLAVLTACSSRDELVRIETQPRLIMAEPDAMGRQLRDAPHVMDPLMFDELRTAVPRFAGLDDQTIMKYMGMMGPNYTWYLSDPSLSRRYGVLLLAHGFLEQGDRVFSRRLQPIAAENPTALSLGMSMMSSDHIQLGVNNLEAAGASDVIVIPVVATRHNTLLRQWDYIFGLEQNPEYASVPRVGSRARLHFVEPLEDHPLVGDTLVDYSAEISRDPQREEVIIVSHGPQFEADNQAQLSMLRRLADYVESRSDYAAVRVATLQDDAPPEVRAANVRRLRAMVADAQTRGRDVLVVTNLIGTRIVQSALRRDLRGLDYRFNPKGMVQHPNFVRWIEVSIADTVAASGT